MMPDEETIAILGGTGGLGHGLVLRFCAAGEAVAIGSRSAARAEESASQVRARLPAARVTGRSNAEAAALGGPVVLSVPFDGVDALLPMLARTLVGRLLVETVVPMRVHRRFSELLPVPGAASVGEWLDAALPGVRVVSALKNVPAAALCDLGCPVEGDVLVCGEDAGARAAAGRLIARVSALRAVDAGTIRNARYLEAITALLVSVNKLHGVQASIAVTGLRAR